MTPAYSRRQSGACLTGCQKPAEIRQYDVPKPPHRMLGAVVVRGDEAWFFKVTGPRVGLAAEAKLFESFIRSVRFPESSGAGSSAQGPSWDLPPGWKETGASEARYQTIKFKAGDEDCELAVSKLPLNSPDLDEYLLMNINRWRGQIQLSPLLKDELPKETQRVVLAGETPATLVDLVGTLEPKPPGKKGPMMGPGMGAGMDRGMFSGGGTPRPERRPVPSDDLKYELPQGWAESEPAPLAKLTFEVRDGKQKARVTVTDLPAASNPLLDNVNRWRGMVSLPPVDEAQLAKDVRSVKVADGTGTMVELKSPADAPRSLAIFGVIAYRGDTAWFVKLQGDPEVVEREKSRLEAFVESLKF